eukprot:s9470_g2.t1
MAASCHGFWRLNSLQAYCRGRSLNELNHTPAKLKLDRYNLHATKYCEDLWMSCSHIADALTCRRLDLLAMPFAVISGQQEDKESSSESAESGNTSQVAGGHWHFGSWPL